MIVQTGCETASFYSLCKEVEGSLCCNGISPTLLCLLTQPVGMASRSTTAAKYIYDTLVMVSLGALKMTFAGKTVCPCGSIDTNFDPP
jgi:hypothetical protein